MRPRPTALALAALVALGARATAAEGPPPPAAAPPAAAPAAVATPAPPALDRVQFEFVLPPQRGGGKVVGSAASITTEGEETVIAEGGVELKYQDLSVKAQRLIYRRGEQKVEAEGDIVLDQGPRRLTGKRLSLDLATKQGTLEEAQGQMEPDIFFSGEKISRLGDDLYEIERGVLTSCQGDPTPDWSFHLSSAKVELGGYAHLKNVSMWTKKLPFFYLPYILYPAKTDRASGLLVPNLGYTRRRGAYLGLAYYQTFGPSHDTTLFVDLFSKEYLGLGGEYRYHPSEATKGEGQLYFVDDPVSGDWRWKAKWDHQSSDLPWGLRGVVSYRDFSDFDFFQDFERGLNFRSIRTVPSTAFVAGSWGAHTATAWVERRQTFISADTVIEQNHYPSVQYTLAKRRLGTSPLYLSLDSAASLLDNDRGETFRARYSRFDLAPQITLPLRVFPWLSVSLSAGGRATWYGKSLPDANSDPRAGPLGAFCDDGSRGEDGYCADSFLRATPALSAEIVGPSFSRVFERPLGSFAKFKHLIEPRWSYSYLGEFDDPERMPLFDERDVATFENVGQFELVNRLIAKPADPQAGGAREILSLSLAQAWSFDAERPLQSSRDLQTTSSKSALFGTLRFNPSERASVQAQVQWNTLFGGLESTSLLANVAGERANLALSWFTRYDVEQSLTSQDQARAALGVELIKDRLRLDLETNYDFERGEVQHQRYLFTYVSQCWSMRVELREFKSFDRTDRDYRFALSLKNIGTFLDLGGGTSTASTSGF